ncbi:DUF2378 family protein [Streptomyces sp. NPDC056683]|uniref:DUF2378 family protein n=1 Tax=Streptomyces sp. NPDC056683 TaxID=3345910 RepID=UPI0036B8176A
MRWVSRSSRVFRLLCSSWTASWRVMARQAARAWAGQWPPARSAMMTSGSQVSAARSSTGICGTIRAACPRRGPSQAVSRSRSALSSGTEYRERNGVTFSPGLRFCIRRTTARSMTVSGRSPIPAMAAMAKVGNGVGL